MTATDAKCLDTTCPAVCRFCLSGEKSIPYFGSGPGGEPLINYCNCRGATGLYHKSCMEHWLNTSRTSACDVCKAGFVFKKKKQPFFTYAKEVIFGESYKEERSLLPDVICAIAITPLAVGSVLLCIRSAVVAFEKVRQMDSSNELSDDSDAPILEMAAFSMVALFLSAVYVAWFACTICYHLIEFRIWQKKHILITILDPSIHRNSTSHAVSMESSLPYSSSSTTSSSSEASPESARLLSSSPAFITISLPPVFNSASSESHR
ncbi:hypothetical protein WR25_13433 [Diploscapter pachys]|uniref:RING-CH-type domain-containing protein n=1 Tax=Diploscapter pachys TaxID=2018661 RepID=A0A2A2KGN4_9BILA|nr:hypothetical protein WR25_13433 [Diploscapter pachys]